MLLFLYGEVHYNANLMVILCCVCVCGYNSCKAYTRCCNATIMDI